MTRDEFLETAKELFPNSIFALEGLNEEIVIYTGLTMDSDSTVRPIGV